MENEKIWTVIVNMKISHPEIYKSFYKCLQFYNLSSAHNFCHESIKRNDVLGCDIYEQDSLDKLKFYCTIKN